MFYSVKFRLLVRFKSQISSLLSHFSFFAVLIFSLIFFCLKHSTNQSSEKYSLIDGTSW
jgi:hypothetical protein